MQLSPVIASLLFFLLTSVRFANAQYFEKVYGHDPYTSAVQLATTPENGCMILGNSRDSTSSIPGYYLLKVDSEGNVLWEKKICDAFDAYSSCITSLKDGNFAFIGSHSGPSYQSVAEVVIVDNAGNYLNSQVYPPFDGWGTSGISLSQSFDTSLSISIYTDGFISTNYYSLYHLNRDLSVNWSDFLSYDGSLTNAQGISTTGTGTVYTMAYYDFYPYSINALFKVSNIKKHDAVGSILLDSLYEFQFISTSIISTSDGGAVVCGVQDSSMQKDMSLVRLDNAGSVTWQKQFGGRLDEVPASLVETTDSGFVMLSTISDSILPGQHDILLTKINSAGDSVWSHTFGGVLDETAIRVTQESNDLIILGSTTSFGDDHIYMARTDSAGVIESGYNITSSARYYCEKDTAFLTINPPPRPDMKIEWSTGDTINPAGVMVTGNYFAVVTDTDSTRYTTPLYSVYFAAQAHAAIGPDTLSVCSGTILSDTAPADITNSFQWSFNGISLQDEVNPSIVINQPGTYQLIVKNYCSVDTGSVFIDNVFPLPDEPQIIDPGISFSCAGDTVPLIIGNVEPDQYQWYTADVYDIYPVNGANDTVFLVTAGNVYLVRATNANGCINYSQAISVSYDLDQEYININGPSSFCEGGEVDLSAPNGSNFQWSQGDTTQTITIDSSGVYHLTFIDEFGCPKNSDTISINILNNPQVNLGNDTMLCFGSFITLDAGPGFNSYIWSDGSADEQLLVINNVLVNDTVNFAVSISDTNNCYAVDTVQIIFDLCAGVNVLNEEEFSLFPNPVKEGNSVFVKLKPENSKLIFYDLFGNAILSADIVKTGELTGTTSLKRGIYLYELRNDSECSYFGKLLVK